MALRISWLSNESGEASNAPGEKAATYTEKPIHAAAIAARVGLLVRVSRVDGASPPEPLAPVAESEASGALS